jgi:hypothetical protein
LGLPAARSEPFSCRRGTIVAGGLLKPHVLFCAGMMVGTGAYLGASIATDALRYTEPLRTADAVVPLPYKAQGRVPTAP